MTSFLGSAVLVWRDQMWGQSTGNMRVKIIGYTYRNKKKAIHKYVEHFFKKYGNCYQFKGVQTNVPHYTMDIYYILNSPHDYYSYYY